MAATTRSLRSARSPGQMYGHRCTSVANSVPRSPETRGRGGSTDRVGFMSLTGKPEPQPRPMVEGASSRPHIGPLDIGCLAARITSFAGSRSLGLMGTLAASVLDHGGRVTGVIPEFLTGREHVMACAQEVIVTRDMHERKRIMFDRADAFAALPGGIGTLEELVELITWAQLGRHRKPILLANIEGFWEPLCVLLDHMKTLQFIRAGLAIDLLVANRIEDVLQMLCEAARAVREAAKEMMPVAAERM